MNPHRLNRYHLARFLFFFFLLLFLVVGISSWKLHRSPSPTEITYQQPPLFPQQPSQAPKKLESPPANPSLEALDEEFINLLARVVPSVVSIITTDAPDREILLREFFGFSSKHSSSPNKMGSGMIVSKKGDIITNWHVVKGALDITVELDDGRTLPARLLGFDELADIAVLHIEAESLTPLPFGNSDQVNVGQRVVAIGNPFGLQETVTEGIISAKGRRALSETINEFFQTSALINPGNSGGPLVNIHGEVIGINNFIISRSGGAEGLGFAIPSNVARRVYNDIIHYGHALRPWFGVVLRPLNSSLSKQLGLPGTAGALIAAILPGSPAEKSGLEQGDIIISFNNHPIKDWIDLRQQVAQVEVGKNVPLTIQRGERTLSLSTIIEEQPN